jgi:MFS transporter, ACS family, hexuronate transporter
MGYGLFTLLWNFAGVTTALVNSVLSFGIVRGFVGLTESGSFPFAKVEFKRSQSSFIRLNGVK